MSERTSSAAMLSAKKALRSLAGPFPLTPQGLLTLMVSTWALRTFGYGSMDLVVFALTISALAILMSCLFCTIGFGLFMQRRIRREINRPGAFNNVEIEVGYPNETGFSIPAATFPPLVTLSWTIAFPDGIETRTRIGEHQRLCEEVLPKKRCLTELLIREFSVQDVLGLCQFSWQMRQRLRCQALPQLHAIKQLPLLRSLTAEDGVPNTSGQPEGDRMEIRPYAPGDSIKNIMWNVYARSRQLNVRLPEHSVLQSKRTIAYLLTSDNDEAAAAVARVALQSGALGEDWAFGTDGYEKPISDYAEALTAIAGSRGLTRPHNYGLDRFLDLAGSNQPTHCVVFAEAAPHVNLQNLRKTFATHPGQCSLILATDSLQERQEPPWWQALLLSRKILSKTSSQKPGYRAELLNLLTEIGQQVESTVVIDRETGLGFDRFLRKV